MNDDSYEDGVHNRQSKRSLVLLSAKLKTRAGDLDVRLRNLSQKGALLEADRCPEVGGDVVFERGDTVVPARVAWVSAQRFGVEFLEPIEESEVLIHVGRPKPKPDNAPVFRRTGFRDTTLSIGERKLAESWVRPTGNRLGE